MAVELSWLPGAAVIRLDRPEARNPLSLATLQAIDEALDDVDARSPRSLVFTGCGDSFASGADLREISSLDAGAARQFAERGQRLMQRIECLPMATVSAVNGYCFGGGLDLALACKRRIASPAAVFCHPGVGLGIITGWGGTQRLPRLIGEAKAMEMLLTARRVTAVEALQIGLVDEISDDVISAATKHRDTAAQ